MKQNLQGDTITILNENIPLITTQNGYYAIPIMRAKKLINNLDRETTIGYENVPWTYSWLTCGHIISANSCNGFEIL